MFCKNCGNEVQDTWKACPNCGNQINDNTGVEKPEEKITYKMHKKKALKNGIIAFAIVAILYVIVSVIGSGNANNENMRETPLSLDEVGGFTEWQSNGFKEIVRTDIAVSLPVEERESNNYAVLVGPLSTDVIVIMQEDKSAAKEWDWLMNAEPYIEGGDKAYFMATLDYTEMDTEEGFPIFIVSDVESYIDTSLVETTEEPTTITLPITVVNNTGFDIYELYASVVDTEDWEEDILGLEVLLAGESFTINFTFEPEQVYWDFAIVNSIGDYISFYDLDFSNCNIDGAYLVLEYDGSCGYASLVNDYVQLEVTETPVKAIELDYESIYGGIADMVINEVASNGGLSDYIMYTFYDVNKDGYLEFIIENGTCAADMLYQVYSTNGNVAMKLGEVYGGNTVLYEYSGGNGFYTQYCHMDTELVTFVYEENGSLSTEDVLDASPEEVLATPIEMRYLSDGISW